ncbi:hypothetical protein AN958_11934, partial [Leucoagaricus sp. SymC.cos]
LEHEKSEVYNFSKNPKDTNPPIDLGFAPYTSSLPLCPKQYWQYLGFYFDQQLKFHEHVRYWSTKALLVTYAMRLLGNSVCGLPPHHKRTLYHTCIIPLATYGYRLWYFANAKCSKNLKTLQKLQ